ncbi:methyl-accepting chemotaxis protein [Vibrio sp. 10N.261.45.A7]
MKFSHKVVAASSALLLVTVSLLSIQQLYTVRSAVENHVSTSLKEMVSGVKNTVVSEMNAKKALAQSTTEVIEINPEDRAYVKEILEKPKLKNSFLAVGFGYEANGFVIENDDGWEAGPDYDPRIRPWYIDAKSKNSLVVTAPYVDVSSKKVIISVGTPVKDNGRFTAGMFYDLELTNLATLINQVNLFDAGYLFLVTADGTTIAHPNAKNNGEMLSSYMPQATIREGSQEIEVDGKMFLINFTHIPSEDWYIGAILDEEIAFQTVEELKHSSMIYSLIAVILSIIALTVLIRVLMRPLDALNQAIQDVASGQGDLTKRLDTNTDQEFSDLAEGFNTFTENLQNQIIQSKAIGVEIKRGTEITVKGAGESANAMNTQLQELEQLATAMNEMAVTATEVANNAQGAAAAAREADEATLDGTSVVSDTTQAIDNLSARIDQAVTEVQVLESATANIETILKVINDIAEQTNLLALNAAIEAARAGEQGRGFAVVADEVRVLSQRTHGSTEEIRVMIDTLQKNTEHAVESMTTSTQLAENSVGFAEQAHGSLTKITQAITEINDMALQIASAAEEQRAVSEDISRNTQGIKDASDDLAQQAESSRNSSNEMSHAAESMRRDVERFKV